MYTLNSALCKATVLALCLYFSALGQILQDHPELCGDSTRYVPIPSEIASIREPWISTGSVALVWQAGGISHRVDLHGDIRELCPIPEDRLVVFQFDGGYHITILDRAKGTPIDDFLAFDPLISPDEHWLVMRAFHPPMSEVPISDTYLLYPLLGGHGTARQEGQLYAGSAKGHIIYPLLEGSNPFNLADIPEADTHYFRSESFYWSTDSQFVVFADSAHETISVVVATITDGKSSVYVHPVSAAEVCQDGPAAGFNPFDLILSHARIDSIPGANLELVAEFKSATPECTPKELRLTQADFQPAKPEVYNPIPRKKPVGIRAH